MRFFLILLLCFAVLPAQANDTALLRQAVQAADKREYSRAITLARRAGYPFVADALRGEAYANDGLGTSYAELAEFLAAYPVWPARNTLVTIAEGYLVPDQPPADLDRFYAAGNPVTGNGLEAYVNFLRARGQNHKAMDLVRTRWVNGPLPAGTEADFRQRYSRFLSTADDVARLDRLVWDQESLAARTMYAYVDAGQRALAEARFALQRGDIDAPAKLQRVPPELQDDAGLLWARAHFRREAGDNTGAVKIMNQVNGAPDNPKAWWTERHILIRDLMEEKNYRVAYKVAARHGLEPGGKVAGEFASAEFIAGWLALRFLDNPQQAAEHFNRLTENVMQPVSKSRGAYWLGRAYEALGDRENARHWYTQAAQYKYFFYGQLAMAKLTAKPVLRLDKEPAVPQETQARLNRNPLVQIIKAFTAVGDKERAEPFLRALLTGLNTRAEYVVAAQLGRAIAPEMEIEAVKAANGKGFMLDGYGYPQLRLGDRAVPEAALTLGLIRQESQFEPDVESPVGALGLMQLMPSSARQIAKKYDEPYRGPDSLTDPALNITLGRHYLSDRIEQFDGSYIKAIAAYNAGQGRVRQWEEIIGDPKAGADPIDWIELIPIYETRNYVQRVLEATQVYRALLQSNKSAPLNIATDLVR